MKTLQQYINEKLIINRNFNSADYELPKDDGYCLRVGYPYGNSPHLVKRISLEYVSYDKQTKNDVECIYLGHKNLHECYKSSEGIFYYTNQSWIFILFFGNTAKDIIDIAIKNPDAEFDFKHYIPSLNSTKINFNNVYKIGDYELTNYTRQPYKKDYLNYLKKQIK